MQFNNYLLSAMYMHANVYIPMYVPSFGHLLIPYNPGIQKSQCSIAMCYAPVSQSL